MKYILLFLTIVITTGCSNSGNGMKNPEPITLMQYDGDYIKTILHNQYRKTVCAMFLSGRDDNLATITVSNTAKGNRLRVEFGNRTVDVIGMTYQFDDGVINTVGTIYGKDSSRATNSIPVKDAAYFMEALLNSETVTYTTHTRDQHLYNTPVALNLSGVHEAYKIMTECDPSVGYVYEE